MRNHRIVGVVAGLLALVLATPAFAGLGAGVAAGYLHIEIDDDADTYQVGPTLDYWGERFGFSAKALFSTYTFEFSQQVAVNDQPVNLFVTEKDDNFRVDVDVAGRYLATDWLILLVGYRFEVQDFDSSFDLEGDPLLVEPVRNDPRVQALLADAENNFGRGFKAHSLALAATVFKSFPDSGTTPYFTATLFPLTFVDSDITALVFDSTGGATSVKADDVTGFGGFAFEAGVDQAISAVDGLSVGLGIRYQQMTIFSDDDLLLLDDEILFSVLPYVHYGF